MVFGEDLRARPAAQTMAATGLGGDYSQVLSRREGFEKYNIFQDIAERTGAVSISVLSAQCVPANPRLLSALWTCLSCPVSRIPIKQSASGPTASKWVRSHHHDNGEFVPDEPVELSQDHLWFHLRLVDCGYTAPGAMGYVDESGPRMVRTPGLTRRLPFNKRKLVPESGEEHSTLGLVVVTDGSITDCPENYLAAEEQVISELRELGKPFMVLLNSRYPKAEATQELASELEEKYQVTVVPVDCLNLTEEDLLDVLHEMLFEFPIREIGVRVSQWVEELDPQHWVREKFEEAIFDVTDQITRIRDIDQAVQDLAALDISEHVTLADMDLGEGAVLIDVQAPRSLFYQVLQELTGFEVSGDHHLMRLMRN